LEIVNAQPAIGNDDLRLRRLRALLQLVYRRTGAL